MDQAEKKAREILKKRSHGDTMAPEKIDDDFFEGDGLIGDAVKDAVENVKEEKKQQQVNFKKRASKKRKEVNKIKKEVGIRRGKQSKFPNRSYDFLKDDDISKRAIQVVLTTHPKEKIYLDGADIAPRLLLGRDYFGKNCTLNAFQHLMTVQEILTTNRGENPKNAPNWIIIKNNTSMIMDRNLITRLEELKPTTHVAGTYGFERIRASGKWYQIDGTTEQRFLRGCYVQGRLYNSNWDFIVGSKFKDSPRYRVMIVSGPFIAVRGEAFMTMDFTDMAKNMTSGFHHYMAHISMECMQRGLMAAQIKSIAAQYDNIKDMKEDPDFNNDQAYFSSRWQSALPASIYPNDDFK